MSHEFEKVFEQMLQRNLRLEHFAPHMREFYKMFFHWRNINSIMKATSLKRNTINSRLNKMVKRGLMEKRVVYGNEIRGPGPKLLWRLK